MSWFRPILIFTLLAMVTHAIRPTGIVFAACAESPSRIVRAAKVRPAIKARDDLAMAQRWLPTNAAGEKRLPSRVGQTTWSTGSVQWIALFPIAAQDGGDAAVQQGRDALRHAGSFPWYDRGTDSVKPPDGLSSSKAGADNRRSDWVAQEKESRASPSTSTNWGNVSELLLTILMWGLIAIILIGLIVFLVWAFMRYETAQDQDDVDDWLEDPRSDEQRIEDLPFEIKKPTSDLLAAAERARAQGDRRLAMIYLFSHMLVQMDRNHRIRLAKGKTNRQYLKEIVNVERLHPIVFDSMIAFERVFFGNHDLDPLEFDHVWNSLGAFETYVKPSK